MISVPMPDGPSENRIAPGPPPVRGAILAGAAATVLGIGGFFGWAATAPLASAVLAHGTVQADSNRKIIQHLDGGIIRDLLVRDGDLVETGRLLVRLDDVELRAQFDALEGRRQALLAEEARLVAERDGLPDLAVPEELDSGRWRSELAHLLKAQRRLFTGRRDQLEGQLAILRQQIARNLAAAAALEAQIAAGGKQRALIEQERSTVEEMVSKGFERRPRLLALERAAVQLEGDEAAHRGRLAQAHEAIAEAKLQQAGLLSARQAEAAAALREVQMQRMELDEKRRAAAARLARSVVVAPETGTVLNLRTHTVGGVVAPGGAILDLVPHDDRLVVEARIQPVDIDMVRVGMAAQVALTAYKSRTTPRLEGRVTRLSADALTDERSGARYFLARVEVPIEEIERSKLDDLHPGMPAEVLMMGEERTMLHYLAQPLRDSFSRAFREQ